jgi:hypothetical protein
MEIGLAWLAIELAETVSVVAPDPKIGVTLEGEKLHDIPGGNPEHENDMVWLKPLNEAMETIVDAA